MMRAEYFKLVFSGTGVIPDINPYEAITKESQFPQAGRSRVTDPDWSRFFYLWQKRGLAFRDQVSLWIRRDKLDCRNPLVIETGYLEQFPTYDGMDTYEKLELSVQKFVENPDLTALAKDPSAKMYFDQDAICELRLRDHIKINGPCRHIVVGTLDLKLVKRIANTHYKITGQRLEAITLVDPTIMMIGTLPDASLDYFLIEDQGAYTFIEESEFYIVGEAWAREEIDSVPIALSYYRPNEWNIHKAVKNFYILLDDSQRDHFSKTKGLAETVPKVWRMGSDS